MRDIFEGFPQRRSPAQHGSKITKRQQQLTLSTKIYLFFFFAAILGVICWQHSHIFAHNLADNSDRLIFPGEMGIAEESPTQHKSSIASRQTSGTISDIVIAQQNQQTDQINKYLTSGRFPAPNTQQKPQEQQYQPQQNNYNNQQTIKQQYEAEQMRQRYEQERLQQEHHRQQLLEQQRIQEEHQIRIQQQEDIRRQQVQQQYFPQPVDQKSPAVTENYIDPLNFQLPHAPNRITSRPHQPSESDAITGFAWRLFKVSRKCWNFE